LSTSGAENDDEDECKTGHGIKRSHHHCNTIPAIYFTFGATFEGDKERRRRRHIERRRRRHH
jgi:hypothetical protein